MGDTEPSAADAVAAGDPDLARWLGRLQEESFRHAGSTTRTAYPPQRRMSPDQLAAYLTQRTYALVSSTRPDGRAHAAPTLFTCYGEAFWLPTLATAIRLANVRAHPWLALSVVEGEHETHAAVLAEGPAAVLTAAPEAVCTATESRNANGSLGWASAWLRLVPERLFSFAERGWRGSGASSADR